MGLLNTSPTWWHGMGVLPEGQKVLRFYEECGCGIIEWVSHMWGKGNLGVDPRRSKILFAFIVIMNA